MDGSSKMTQAKRAKITPENLAESRALKALWDDGRAHRTQAEFGDFHDLGNQANVGHYLNGRSALNLKAANAFAKELQCSVAEFSPRLFAELNLYRGSESSVVGEHQLMAQEEPIPFRSSNTGARHAIMQLGALLAPLDSTERKIARVILEDLATAPENAADMAAKMERLLGEIPQTSGHGSPTKAAK